MAHGTATLTPTAVMLLALLHEDDMHAYEMVRLLRERTRSMQVTAGDIGVGMPRSSLADALEILEGMPEPPPQLMAEVLIEMGDWQVRYARSRVPSAGRSGS